MTFDLRQIRAFCAIIEQGNFSRAAAEIGLTQPTLSTHIKNLEEALSVKLFDRAGRSAHLTPAGRVFHEYARQILALSDSAAQAVVSFLGEISGEVVLLASTVPGEYLLPRWLGGYNRRFPRVKVTLSIGDTRTVADGVLAGEAHLGVTGAPAEHPSLQSHILCQDEIVLAASPEMVRRLRLPVRLQLSHLARIPLIRREKGSGTRKALEGALREMGVDSGDLSWTAVFGSTQAALEGAVSGVGASFLSLRAVAKELRAGHLKRVELPRRITRGFYLVRHASRSLSPVAFHLAETLLSEKAAL